MAGNVLAWCNVKSNLPCARGITPRCATSGRAHLRDLAPKQRSSEETSRRWRAVADSESDLTGPVIEPETFALIAMSLTTSPISQSDV